MKQAFRHCITVALLLSSLTPVIADTSFDSPGNYNPIVPGYFADPTLKKFGDTFYLYATTDGNGGGRGPATVWVSKDFVNWVLVPMHWPTTPHYWAPDVVQRPDGRYYLYYNQPCNTFGGVSDTPIGPWTPLTPGDGLVIKDHLIKDVITLDTQTFTDRDGTLYGYWGTWGIFPNSGCGIGAFNPDMKSFSRLTMIPNTQAKDFFEAPFMIERNGVYYFTYSSGSCHDASYRVQYAVGNKPDGEFTMGPNNPILATNADQTIHGPGHHSILQLGDDYFIVYHRHDLPVTPNGMHRQTSVDRLLFERDGVIKQIEPTHQGVGYLGPESRTKNLARSQPVTASSYYHDTLRNHRYKPEYAVDDNNATLWRAGDNCSEPWLQVDLGRVQRVRHTEIQFEYATWYYQYLIEYSQDGTQWQVFADRRQNTRWGSPLVDQNNVEARYLRLTVTGTELPGLFGAIWNFKAYSEVPDDPLLKLADQAFNDAPQGNKIVAAQPLQMSVHESDSEPIIHLDVADLQLGTRVTSWANRGRLGGVFNGGDAAPIIDLADGRKAVRFSGNQMLTSSFPAPRSLSGNSSFTVAMWVHNPQIAESECVLSWAGRGGPDATTAQFGYGTHGAFGAVGHWGFADMAFRGSPPAAGLWHHVAVVFDGVVERIFVDSELNHAAAKMLLMHEGRPIYVGASVPGTEYFDGYLASLRVYDYALPETRIKQLADDAPNAELLVYLDAASLDYGPVASWENRGSLGGSFQAGDNPPLLQDVRDRLAVQFQPHQSLELTLDSAEPLNDFTLLAAVLSPSLKSPACVVQCSDGEGASTKLVVPAADTWQQIALVYQDGHGTVLHNGKFLTQTNVSPIKQLQTVRLGSDDAFVGTVTRLQLFRRALSTNEIAQLHLLWKNEWMGPQPSPARFIAEPAAINPVTVVMTAAPGKSAQGIVEYRFTETTGHAGANSSGWLATPYYLDDGLQPNTTYAYTVKMRDPLGNVTKASLPVTVVTDPQLFEEFEDTFAASHDYLAQPFDGSIWSGLLGKDEGSEPESVTARDGILRLQSKGTVWDGGTPRGVLLYRHVAGDFVVETEVDDYAGLTTRKVPGNNDGGLMVRMPALEDAGPGDDLVQLNFFPIWNQGNMVTSLDSGARPQKGNLLAWNAHRHLQIIRHGSLFYFRTSTDGEHWNDLPGSPVDRQDMAGFPVQVGLYHASYGGESSFVSFRQFRITVSKQTE